MTEHKNPFVLYVNDQPVPVTEEVYRAYYQSVEHAKYQNRRAMAREASLNRLMDAGMSVEAHLAVEEEDILVCRERNALLYAALEALDPILREGLWRLVLAETTERALAEEWGVSRSKVHRMKVQALAQLRAAIEAADVNKTLQS